MLVGQQLHPLLIDRHLLALDAENLKKLIIKSLRLALLVGRVFPFLAKRLGPPLNLVPAQPHHHPQIPKPNLTAAHQLAKPVNSPVALETAQCPPLYATGPDSQTTIAPFPHALSNARRDDRRRAPCRYRHAPAPSQ